MCTTPCGTTRFSRFLRNSFLRLPAAAFAPAAGAPAAAPAASFGSFAISRPQRLASQKSFAAQRPEPDALRVQRLLARHGLLLGGDGTLARTLPGAGVGVRALAAD